VQWQHSVSAHLRLGQLQAEVAVLLYHVAGGTAGATRPFVAHLQEDRMNRWLGDCVLGLDDSRWGGPHYAMP
jgi:hypothetical protein